MLSKSFIVGFVSAIAFGITVTAADKDKKKPDTSKLPPPADKKDLTYAKDIKPILEVSCLKCHSGEKPKSKYRVDTVQAMIKGGESGDAAIIPGKSAESPLIHYVADLVEDM